MCKCRYEDVWRLAPRDELVRKQQVTDIFMGQTLRYICSVRDKPETMMVTKISRTTVTSILECGKNRGETKTIQKYVIVESQEIFGSSLLHSILQKVKKLDWAEAPRSQTPKIPKRRPKLSSEFIVPVDEAYKRK